MVYQKIGVISEVIAGNFNMADEVRWLDRIDAAKTPKELEAVKASLRSITKGSCEHCPAVGGGCIVCS